MRVVEAAADVGGRLRSLEADSRPLELGAQFIGRNHPLMLDLTRRVKLTLEPAHLTRGPTSWISNERIKSGYVPLLSPRALVEIMAVTRSLARRAKTVPPFQPWAGGDSQEHDATSVGEWLDSLVQAQPARSLLEALIRGTFCVDSSQLSLLQLMWAVRRAGGVLKAASGLHQFVIREGAQVLARRIATTLRTEAETGDPVTGIQQDDEVLVHREQRESIRCKRAIVAIPPSVLSSIRFDPPLDAEHDFNQLQFGQALKVCGRLAHFKRNTPRVLVGDDRVWLGWRTGPVVAGLAPPTTSPIEAAQVLQETFGGFIEPPEVLDWSQNRLSRGTYVAFAPGQLCRLGPRLNDPQGLVDFAGAERSSWPNNMEGAVESGLAAARRVMDALRT